MKEISKHEKQQQFDKHLERITELQELLEAEEERLHERIKENGEQAFEDYINSLLIDSEQ